MNLIPNQLAKAFSRQVLVAQKQSPHILFAAGILGAVTSTVLACRATLKLGDTLDDFKSDIETVKEHRQLVHSDRSVLAIEQDGVDVQHNRVMMYAYTRGTYRIVKLYAPALVLGVVSVAALTGSHITLTRRNTSLMAAYAAISNAYNEYRERVRKELGPEKELDIYRGASIENAKGWDEAMKASKVADPNKLSIYSRFFDETSNNWQPNTEYNLIFLKASQNYHNHLLQSRGHVFLNEVYDHIGIPRSKAGQSVGWVLNNGGDNFIDYGIYELTNAAFVNGFERSILLDFNVDGVIWDNI